MNVSQITEVISYVRQRFPGDAANSSLIAATWEIALQLAIANERNAKPEGKNT